MSACSRCGKPVYFAERKTSLGKHWHRQCLRCDECGKVLNPGQHAEHKGLPFCHHPCYSALFGPRISGFGVPIVAYTNYGNRDVRTNGSYRMAGVDREEILNKLRAYNEHYEGKNGQLACKEVNNRLILEGLLRLRWGVTKEIHLKPKDDIPAKLSPRRSRKSYMLAIDNGLDEIFDNNGHGDAGDEDDMDDAMQQLLKFSRQHQRRGSMEDVSPTKESKNEIKRFNTVCYRGDRGNRNKRKRFSINGHFYDHETSVFTPTHGTVTSVRVSSTTTTPEVIQVMLDKFKVEDDPEDFTLFIMKTDGGIIPLLDTDYPLFERLLLGPEEDEAKIYIMEKSAFSHVPQEVSQYVTLPEAVLHGFLDKFTGEEEKEVQKLKQKYATIREALGRRLSEIQTKV
ncbi:ras association domain-containing protein 2-like isoform X2 [Lineus longissimus]|uniref:ras association domain-containing protein 2-like isoform X2 n=1 Tax=Lineus longissimus TaxID=88925 RepID=UPI002B4E13D2